MSFSPDFIVIGAMKCATTTLHVQLAAQPGICLSDKLEEPDYFSDSERYARGPEWYASLFKGANPDDLVGDISTGYAKLPTDPSTVERIQKDVADPRIVYLMRHPVDRLVSHYIHDWSVGRVTEPIDEAVKSHRPMVDYGRYAMQLEPYLTAFGPGRVLPVFFERLIGSPQVELERICSFIGYAQRPEWTSESDHANASSQRLKRSPLRDAIISFPLIKTIRRNLVPQSLRDRVKRLWAMNERPSLSHDIESEVIAEFDADLATIGTWLGIELNCENFKSHVRELDPVWTDETPEPSSTNG